MFAENGDSYISRFSTNGSFQNVRIPYNAFRKNEGASEEAPQQMLPEDIRSLAVMAEYRARSAKRSEARDLDSMMDRSDREFKLEINRIHVSTLELDLAWSKHEILMISCMALT